MTPYEFFLYLRMYGIWLFPLLSVLKIRIGQTPDGRDFILTEEDLARHLLMTGDTGMGKSKVVTSMGVQMAEQGQGFAEIDTDTKTAQDTFAGIHESPNVSPAMKAKTILFRPGPDQTIRYDAFETQLLGKLYRYWLFRIIKLIGRILGRKQGQADYKEQPRRERWMTNVLWLVGMKVNGKHLGLHRALDVLELGTPAWDRMFAKIEPHLPIQVAVDWKKLRTMSYRDRWIYTESTSNWFTQFFSDLVLETLSGPAEPIDFHKIVSEGWIFLADFGETLFFSKEQGEAFAALVICSLLDAAYFVNR